VPRPTSRHLDKFSRPFECASILGDVFAKGFPIRGLANLVGIGEEFVAGQTQSNASVLVTAACFEAFDTGEPEEYAAQYGPMKVAYFLGMWPIYKDYIERPEDPSIWPIRGLIVSGPIGMQPKLCKLMDYQWRFDMRHRGRRLVPGGYIPMHYIDECFYLDGNVPTGPTLWSDGDRGRGWTEYEATWKMV